MADLDHILEMAQEIRALKLDRLRVSSKQVEDLCLAVIELAQDTRLRTELDAAKGDATEGYRQGVEDACKAALGIGTRVHHKNAADELNEALCSIRALLPARSALTADKIEAEAKEEGFRLGVEAACIDIAPPADVTDAELTEYGRDKRACVAYVRKQLLSEHGYQGALNRARSRAQGGMGMGVEA